MPKLRDAAREFQKPDGSVVSSFGSNREGSRSYEYCVICFREGAFTMPNLTLDEMIAMSVENMTGEQGIPEARARDLANTVIPKLRRWAGQKLDI